MDEEPFVGEPRGTTGNGAGRWMYQIGINSIKILIGLPRIKIPENNQTWERESQLCNISFRLLSNFFLTTWLPEGPAWALEINTLWIYLERKPPGLFHLCESWVCCLTCWCCSFHMWNLHLNQAWSPSVIKDGPHLALGQTMASSDPWSCHAWILHLSPPSPTSSSLPFRSFTALPSWRAPGAPISFLYLLPPSAIDPWHLKSSWIILVRRLNFGGMSQMKE